jgi:phosphatidylglycerophosphate synthase
VVPLDALAAEGSRPAVLVPPTVLIEPSLVGAAGSAGSPAWLYAADGAAVLAGPARELAGCCQRAAAQRVGRTAAPPDSIADAGSRRARRRAGWRILRRTAKPTDGWVARHCNRPLSGIVSFALLTLRLKPAHASALTLLVGLAAALLATRPGYGPLVATGLLFQLASILDGVDGEMARATLTESDAGARLDTIVDQITYLACFAGVTIGWIREGAGGAAVSWTVLVILALVVTLRRGARFVARHAPNASFVFIALAVRRAAGASGRLGLRLAAALFTLLRRDLFAVVFLAAALGGRRALVPVIVALGGIVANVTFSRYRRELADAAAAERLAAQLASPSAA